MKEYFSILKNMSLFRDIDENQISDVLSIMKARVCSYAKGTAVILEGDRADRAGILLSGKLHIVREDFYGNRNIVSDINPGELFAEVFAFSDTDIMPVSVFAEEESRVLFIDCASMMSSAESKNQYAEILLRNMLRIISDKALLLNRNIGFLSKRTTREKLMAYLSFNAKNTRSSSFTIPFTRQELADFLCVDRSAMSAELSRMQKDGLIEYDRNRFCLKGNLFK